MIIFYVETIQKKTKKKKNCYCYLHGEESKCIVAFILLIFVYFTIVFRIKMAHSRMRFLKHLKEKFYWSSSGKVNLGCKNNGELIYSST